MANNLSYEFNYKQPPALKMGPRPESNAPLFASQDGSVASLSSQECVFIVKRTGDTHVMTFQVLQALDLCREFRSLDDHTTRIQSTISGLVGKREDVRRVLESLVQRGLLVSDQMFVDRIKSARPRPTTDLRAVFIRACDRPKSLSRLLRSLTDYERNHQAGRRYVLLDDSGLAANIDEQRDLLREFARTTGCKTSYFGFAERAKLIDKFNKARPHAKSVTARLLERDAHPHAQRFGGGRGWNMALLLSAGARMAMLDDDLTLPFRRPDFEREGLNPNPDAVASARFPSNMEEAFAAGEEIAGDPFALHLASCGQNLGSVIHAHYPIDRSSLRGMNLGRLDTLNESARIIATQAGSYGSSRTETALWLYQLDADSRADFWNERASYQRNVEAQHLWHTVAQARVMSMANFTPFTVDNSSMLPCTNPVGRGEDGYAGALMRYCYPDTLTLDLPESIGHMQESARKRSDKTLSAFLPRVNHFMRDFVARQFGLFSAADPAERLQFMADVMRDQSSATETDRITRLREYLSYVRADIIDRIQHQIEAVPDAPVYWQADARSIVQENAKALLAKTPPRLGDWPEDIDGAGCARALSSELDTLADDCEHWPALWQFAAEQGEKLLSTV
ncbi:MAG: hypothetical protein ABJB01_01975 [Rudaea sp.]